MHITRRQACLLLPLLGASSNNWSASSGSLPSSMQPFETLSGKKDGQATYRAILEGKTHTGDYLEVHVTVLEPNGEPHPPHRHAGEELFLIVSGTMEFHLNGKTTRLGPGSAVFVAANDEHGLRNVGTTPVQYFVITLGEKAP